MQTGADPTKTAPLKETPSICLAIFNSNDLDLTPKIWHCMCFLLTRSSEEFNVDGIQAEGLIQEGLATRYIESQANLLMKNDQTREPWMDLCEQAAVEEDSEKLLLLAQEIIRLLDEKKEDRLKSFRLNPDDHQNTSF